MPYISSEGLRVCWISVRTKNGSRSLHLTKVIGRVSAVRSQEKFVLEKKKKKSDALSTVIRTNTLSHRFFYFPFSPVVKFYAI